AVRLPRIGCACSGRGPLAADRGRLLRTRSACRGSGALAPDAVRLPRIGCACSGRGPLAADRVRLLRTRSACRGPGALAPDAVRLPRIGCACSGRGALAADRVRLLRTACACRGPSALAPDGVRLLRTECACSGPSRRALHPARPLILRISLRAPGMLHAGARMTELAIVLVSGVLGLAFAVYLARWVLACPPADDGGPPAPTPGGLRQVAPAPAAPGDREMARVAGLVRAAAEAFFRKQSSTIAAVSAVLGGAIFLAYGLRRAGEGD